MYLSKQHIKRPLLIRVGEHRSPDLQQTVHLPYVSVPVAGFLYCGAYSGYFCYLGGSHLLGDIADNVQLNG